MLKNRIALLINTIILFSCVGVLIHFMPLLTAPAGAVSRFLVPLASPDYLADSVKSKITGYIPQQTEDTTNIPVEESEPVMQRAGSAERNDGTDITAVPPDIAQLMKAAEQNVKEENARGRTSEEPYLGGGTLLEADGIEIQSKIPEDFYRPDIPSLLQQDADLVLTDKTKPTILIYHSHTTEAYSLLDTGYYIESDARSKDNARNVVRVGDELAAALEQAGFSVLHDTEIHDTDYNSSYDESRAAVERYLEEYPSIEVTIDLHRDDITYSDKTKVKPTAVINGKKAARMMLIAGCEYGKVVNFPDWEYNLRFDLQVQQAVNREYAGLMRPILFSQRKYNMYETHNSFLLEVGTDANTLDEACYAARLFGKAFGDLLNDKYVRQGAEVSQ